MTDVLGVHFDPDTVYINITRKCANARQKWDGQLLAYDSKWLHLEGAQ